MPDDPAPTGGTAGRTACPRACSTPFDATRHVGERRNNGAGIRPCSPPARAVNRGARPGAPSNEQSVVEGGIPLWKRFSGETANFPRRGYPVLPVPGGLSVNPRRDTVGGFAAGPNSASPGAHTARSTRRRVQGWPGVTTTRRRSSATGRPTGPAGTAAARRTRGPPPRRARVPGPPRCWTPATPRADPDPPAPRRRPARPPARTRADPRARRRDAGGGRGHRPRDVLRGLRGRRDRARPVPRPHARHEPGAPRDLGRTFGPRSRPGRRRRRQAHPGRPARPHGRRGGGRAAGARAAVRGGGSSR